jgi:ubiquinone/menaquinone biosynthesis C-methylase UbiE
MLTTHDNSTQVERHPPRDGEDSSWKARHIAAVLDPLLPQTLCEVQCGAGQVLALLSERYRANATGYDTSPDAIALASDQHPRLRFVVGHPEGDVHYDVLMLLDVLEHVEDPFTLLRQMRGFAKYFVFHFALDISAQSVLRDGLKRSREQLGHVHQFSRETALALVRECGYRSKEWRYLPWAVERRSASLRSKRVHVPRRLFWRLSPTLMSRTIGGVTLLVLAETDAGGRR